MTAPVVGVSWRRASWLSSAAIEDGAAAQLEKIRRLVAVTESTLAKTPVER